MSVVIDQVVMEAGDESTRSASAPSSGGGGGDRAEPDMDRLDYLMRRSRHRAARLWAD
jgi:hypothetical protein